MRKKCTVKDPELRARLSALGLTQTALAERCGIELRTFQRWLAGGRLRLASFSAHPQVGYVHWEPVVPEAQHAFVVLDVHAPPKRALRIALTTQVGRRFRYEFGALQVNETEVVLVEHQHTRSARANRARDGVTEVYLPRRHLGSSPNISVVGAIASQWVAARELLLVVASPGASYRVNVSP